jgi:hypothetical protein
METLIAEFDVDEMKTTVTRCPGSVFLLVQDAALPGGEVDTVELDEKGARAVYLALKAHFED